MATADRAEIHRFFAPRPGGVAIVQAIGGAWLRMTDVWDKDFLLLQVARGRSAELKPNTVQLRTPGGYERKRNSGSS